MPAQFILDERLKADTFPVLDLGLCRILLMNDQRWPWLILVPRRRNIEEIFDLSDMDQALVAFEVNQIAKILRVITGCDKINIGALGNSVRQLHIHIIARTIGDSNWPGPVWGFEQAVHYQNDEAYKFISQLTDYIEQDDL